MIRARLLLSLFVPVATAAAAESTSAPLVATIELVEPAGASERLVISWRLRNRSSRAIPIAAWHLPAARLEADLFEVRRDGEPVPYRGRAVARGVPAAPDLVPLAPGEGFAARIDLAGFYDLSRPGRYTVRYRVDATAVVGASFVVARLASNAVVVDRPAVLSEPILPVRPAGLR